ncbi:hypothetical protein J31TS4_17210 [Paenibacillus sp. J31TS4]|uniref:hypothetical protein n=1 Tax=Paenibacillus sp. J31TS4 TaxID=2807195 RepID=UPI001B2B7BC6|nr:hypothetical protein [Paenibacillus sp. J31TS4]GIP38441.1 hypothetical protein J31TS4_17210 [Paenibacillus sp. J31TS4]
MDAAIEIYKKIGALTKTDAGYIGITKLFLELHKLCHYTLESKDRTPLVSRIPGKQYFVFRNERKISRAINTELYIEDEEFIEKTINYIIQDQLEYTDATNITKVLYTLAISFCAVIDLSKDGDQKTPGTFFEYFSCHWFAIMLKIQPQTSIDVLNLDMKTSLTTDYIFDLGTNRPKIHMPVKTSTRERVIQVWAHQRVLDGVYGTGRFLGMLVCLSETKTNNRLLDVTEICLPDQWRLYQMFISQMYRIYYLDTPVKYIALNNIFPPIYVKPLGEFFYEASRLFEKYQ